MMNNSAASTNHTTSQMWTDYNDWSTSSQELFPHQHTGSHHLSPGLFSEQRTSYDPSQGTNQSCIYDPSALNSSISNRHNVSYNDATMNSGPSSNMLFNHISVSRVPPLVTFTQPIPHTSISATNQEQSIPLPSNPQQNQRLVITCRNQDLSYSQPSVKSSVSTQCLPNRHPELPTTCEQFANSSQTALETQNAKSVFTAYNESSASSSTPQDQSHWVFPSLSAGDVEKTPLVESVPTEKKKPQTTDTVPQSLPPIRELLANVKNAQKAADNSRAAILQKRALLLQQLEHVDELLLALPPDNTDEFIVPESPEAKRETISDENQIQLPQREINENNSDAEADTDNEEDPECMSHSEGSDTDCPTNDAPVSASRSPVIKRTLPVKEKMDEIISPLKKKFKIDQSVLKTVLSPTSNIKVGFSCNKKNYCLFCSKPMINMARHLEKAHSDQPQVAFALQYPANSSERQIIWEKLKIGGTLVHNRKILPTGEEEVAVEVKPEIPTNSVELIHCVYCRGLFKKSSLCRHVTSCSERTKTKENSEIGKGLVVQSVLLAVDCDQLAVSADLKNILGEMIHDDVTRAVLSDKIILQFGEQMCVEQVSNAEKFSYIKQNLRQIARLLLEAQRTTPMRSMKDFFYPSNFKHVVSTVNELAGYDAEKKAFRCPSYAIKLGNNLQKACCIVQANALESGDSEMAESAKNFLSAFQKKWSTLISVETIRSIKESEEEKMDIEVSFAQFMEDLKLLHSHMENIHLEAKKKLREELCADNFTALARIVLARIVVFNRRETKDVAKMSVMAFMSRKKSGVLNGEDLYLSDMEKTLCGFFPRVEIRGSCGRLVPVLLKPSFESSIELLLSVREKCGILSNNPYVFARPGKLSPLRGKDCLRLFINECGVRNPEVIKPKNIRKHYTEILQFITMDEDEAKQVFGPKIESQSDDDEDDDAAMEFKAFLEGDDTRHDWEVSSENYDHAGADHHQTMRETPSPRVSESPNKRSAVRRKGKLKWDEAEICAVEKHLMHFIKQRRVPQKLDCFQCLVAEPQALKARSWKGVKDYVRNRITSLRRLTDTGPENGMEPAARETQQKKAGTNVRPRSKPLWDEDEVYAVEKHMMQFISEQRVPHKNDCIRCLEAEPHTLKARSWRGIKNYVKKRIAITQQINNSFDGSQNGLRSKQREHKEENGDYEAASVSQDEVHTPRKEQPDSQNQPSHYEMSQIRTTPERSAKSKKIVDTDVNPKSKFKWDKTEICAVEKHLMQFINEQKIPQKKDCVRCLEAEPDALKSRSWRGVKDYVRNRITSLQRLKDSSNFLENNVMQDQLQQDTGANEAFSESQREAYLMESIPYDLYPKEEYEEMICDKTPPQKKKRPKEKARTNFHPKSKLRWTESEVCAVEKHLMQFINERKVPQKNDCVRCLGAEPHALKARSWRGVKDYVRNRITSLQRQRRPRNLSKKQTVLIQEEEFLQDGEFSPQL